MSDRWKCVGVLKKKEGKKGGGGRTIFTQTVRILDNKKIGNGKR